MKNTIIASQAVAIVCLCFWVWWSRGETVSEKGVSRTDASVASHVKVVATHDNTSALSVEPRRPAGLDARAEAELSTIELLTSAARLDATQKLMESVAEYHFGRIADRMGLQGERRKRFFESVSSALSETKDVLDISRSMGQSPEAALSVIQTRVLEGQAEWFSMLTGDEKRIFAEYSRSRAERAFAQDVVGELVTAGEACPPELANDLMEFHKKLMSGDLKGNALTSFLGKLTENQRRVIGRRFDFESAKLRYGKLATGL